ncbi:MAG: acetyl-CoA carboxylase carboxyltransferase subunit alpha [Crocinitomicaceae bacterium TMED209]|jgi:acetyl-CoA carboxylase carboxyl transferase subunit alpha|nr:MAG: acetyl-CoA carboxylase carboxyltransferase subunit alpha [Crocinitomicaceae bacterium TMED209]|tara:strand:+ start:94 stop:1047 length:954 start_codon:yes stop_codon:yes gene_type:complete
MNYLEFEEPIRQLREQLTQARDLQEQSDVDMESLAQDLESKIREVTEQVYSNLTPWQRVQVSRHPDRPYTLNYIEALTEGNFMELHGDRTVKDDKAMVGGFGFIDDQSVMFIGQQKGVNTKMRQYRNFGMANPEGYRKALRLMKLAEKFNRPIVTLIDTPGAFPGLEAEERGQGEAIARNLIEMCQLRVPVICIVIGEGASGGALGIGIGDRVLMLENTWYSVISPESCSSILWRNWDHKMEAAEALKLTGTDMQKLGLVDGIIPEPLGGAHADRDAMFAQVKKEIKKHLNKLVPMDADKRIDQRIRKFASMGVVNS